MNKLLVLGIALTSLLFGASIIYAGEIGEALFEEQNIEETSTLPPNAGDLGEPQYREELGEQAVYHQVKKGDTLWKIAGNYHVNFKDILNLNTHFIDPDLIYPDDLVKLPINQVQGVQDAYKITE